MYKSEHKNFSVLEIQNFAFNRRLKGSCILKITDEMLQTLRIRILTPSSESKIHGLRFFLKSLCRFYNILFAVFEVLGAVLKLIQMLRHPTLIKLINIYRRFGGSQCTYRQGPFDLLDCLTLILRLSAPLIAGRSFSNLFSNNIRL